MAGRKLAEAWVTIRPDTAGFAAEAKLKVTAALKNVGGVVDVAVSKTSLAGMRAQVKAAFAGSNATVDLSVSKASVAAMRAQVKGAFTGATGTVDLSISKASLAKMRATVKTALAGSVATASVSVSVTKSSLALIRAQVRAALDGITFSPAITNASVAAARAKMKAGLTGLSVSINTTGLAPTLAKLAAINAAAGTQGRTVNGLGLIWGRWGRLSLTALHWIVTASLELLAVLVPATAAAAAWAAVWIQGTTNVVQHMKSVYAATESIGSISSQTAGQMIGLGNSLQKAQDKANPDVYQALGGAIKLVNSQSGAFVKAGLAVGKVFDTFTAKLVYDFSKSGDAGRTMGKIFAQMVPDLTKVGQVFGNLGHTIAILAASMPGLAEILLGLLAVILHGINDIVSFAAKFTILGQNIFFALIAVEEFMRWGGLFVKLMGAMGIATDALGPKFLSLRRFSGVFTSIFKLPLNASAAVLKAAGAATSGISGLVGKLGGLLGGAGGNLAKFGAKGEAAGAAMAKFGTRIEKAAAAIPAWQVAVGVVAAAALGYLIYKLATGTTAAQRFAQSLVDAVDKAKNVQSLTVISNGLSQLSARIGGANTQLRTYTARATEMGVANQRNAVIGGKFAGSVGGVVEQMNNARGAVAAYTQGQQKLAGESVNVLSNSARLAGMYHTTIPGAMALADLAGVKLTKNIFGQGEAAFIARNKIANLVLGYTAMGRPLSVVGNDMVAVSIQAGLQSSKIATVTQAWSSFLSTLTGGTNDLAGFQNSLKNMLAAAASFSHNLGKGGGLSASVKQFALDLTNSGKKGSQAWQNFDQVVGQTAPDLINWLSTAGTMGVVSGKQFTQAAKDMVAQLLPFAAKSKTARAELSGLVQMAGGPAITSLKGLREWVGKTGNPTKDLSRIVGVVTQKMADMSKVAQNLGTVLQTQLVNMMDAARLSAAGVQGKMVAYTNDLEHNAQATAKGQADRKALVAALALAGIHGKAAAQYINALNQSIHGNNNVVANGNQARTGFNKAIIDMFKDLPKASKAILDNSAALRDYHNWLDKSHVAARVYADDVRSGTQYTHEGLKDRARLITDLMNTGINAKQAARFVQGLSDKVQANTKVTIPNFKSLQTMIDKLKAGQTPSHTLAKIIATELNPSVKDGALKNDKLRTAIYNMATTAGYTGPNKIRPLRDWMDKNRDSTRDATNWVHNFNQSLNNLNGKQVSATVKAHAIGQGLVSFTEKGLPSNARGFLSFHAKGAKIPGYGGGDKYPAMLEGGETVVPKHLTPLVAPLMAKHKVPGFSQGGFIAPAFGNELSHLSAKAFDMQGWQAAKTSNFMQAAQKQFMDDAIAAARASWLSGLGDGASIAKYARSFATGNGHPYVWGGNSPRGWDCSGFTSFVYDHFGYRPPRTSETQYTWGQKSRDQPGALVFFDTHDGQAPPSHVGISMGNGMMANAEAPGIGTVMAHIGANMGFRIPRGGFKGGGGGGTQAENQISQIWIGAGGPRSVAHIAAAIAEAESGGRDVMQRGQPYATTGWGLWQITPGNSEPQFGINSALLNPVNNARAAVAKYHQAGNSFAPWTTFVDGAYRRFMSDGGLVPMNSFDRGGHLPPGLSLAWNGTGKPEKVTTGGDAVKVELHVKSSNAAFDLFMTQWLQHAVYVKGGGNVQVAFGRKA